STRSVPTLPTMARPTTSSRPTSAAAAYVFESKKGGWDGGQVDARGAVSFVMSDAAMGSARIEVPLDSLPNEARSATGGILPEPWGTGDTALKGTLADGQLIIDAPSAQPEACRQTQAYRQRHLP